MAVLVLTINTDAPKGKLDEVIAVGDDKQTAINISKLMKEVVAGSMNAEIDVCVAADIAEVNDGYFKSGSFYDGDGDPSYSITNINQSYNP